MGILAALFVRSMDREKRTCKECGARFTVSLSKRKKQLNQMMDNGENWLMDRQGHYCKRCR